MLENEKKHDGGNSPSPFGLPLESRQVSQEDEKDLRSLSGLTLELKEMSERCELEFKEPPLRNWQDRRDREQKKIMTPFEASPETVERVKQAILIGYGNLDQIANDAGVRYKDLTNIIMRNLELREMINAAARKVKNMMDSQFLNAVQKGEVWAIRQGIGLMYSGRAKGGYNPSELGTTGYDDFISEERAAKTRKDVQSSQIVVMFGDNQETFNQQINVTVSNSEIERGNDGTEISGNLAKSEASLERTEKI